MPRLFYLPLVEPGVLLSLKAAKTPPQTRNTSAKAILTRGPTSLWACLEDNGSPRAGISPRLLQNAFPRSPSGGGLQPAAPALWFPGGRVLLSFSAFVLIICAFGKFVNSFFPPFPGKKRDCRLAAASLAAFICQRSAGRLAAGCAPGGGAPAGR